MPYKVTRKFQKFTIFSFTALEFRFAKAKVVERIILEELLKVGTLKFLFENGKNFEMGKNVSGRMLLMINVA